MLANSNTALKKRQEKLRLTPGESALVENADANRGFTYTVPATALARCYACHAVTAEVILASGYAVNVDLELDHGEPRAVLTSPHTCPESQSLGEFRDAPTEQWDGAGQ